MYPFHFFSLSHPPDIKAIVHRDPECGALQCLSELSAGIRLAFGFNVLLNGLILFGSLSFMAHFGLC